MISGDPIQRISVSIIMCSHLYIVAFSGTSPRISSLAPSHLNSPTSLRCNGCTLRIESVTFIKYYFYYLWWYSASSIDVVVWFEPLIVSRSFRTLNSNQLTGTIPPQLSNLTKLLFLYTHRIVLHNSIRALPLSPIISLLIDDFQFRCSRDFVWVLTLPIGWLQLFLLPSTFLEHSIAAFSSHLFRTLSLFWFSWFGCLVILFFRRLDNNSITGSICIQTSGPSAASLWCLVFASHKIFHHSSITLLLPEFYYFWYAVAYPRESSAIG